MGHGPDHGPNSVCSPAGSTEVENLKTSPPSGKRVIQVLCLWGLPKVTRLHLPRRGVFLAGDLATEQVKCSRGEIATPTLALPCAALQDCSTCSYHSKLLPCARWYKLWENPQIWEHASPLVSLYITVYSLEVFPVNPSEALHVN